MKILAALVVLLATACHCFYIPGVAPQEFSEGESVEIKAVKLTSVRNPLPYEFYYLPFCRPAKLVKRAENLGEVLRGDRITNTPYKLKMLVDQPCQILCQFGGSNAPKGQKGINKVLATRLGKFIKQDYRIHLLLDNLPVATSVNVMDKGKKTSLIEGFPVGVYARSTKEMALFNHHEFTVKVHQYDKDMWRVVGFEVRGLSVDSSQYEIRKDNSCKIQKSPKPQLIEADKMGKDDTLPIVYSYGVHWEESEIAWASRWDAYLRMTDSQIHWFSIINSFITVVFLTGVCAVILVKTLSRDIARYNEEDEDDAMEPTGWKLVHGDVFRAPPHVPLFVTMVGSGVQLLCCFVVTLGFALLGMLSPASRGALMSVAIFVFVFMGAIAGYFAARLYKTLGGQNWKQAAIQLAVFFPGIVFSMGLFLNFFIWGKHSSGAVPFTTMIALFFMWFGISLPLVMGGFFFGYRKGGFDLPVSVNQIPRQIPVQPWFLSPVASMLIAGLLPFGAVFIELFFIYSAIWENQFYYLFGFLFLVFIVLVIACSEITLVLVYMQLCAESYEWWWRSLLVSGGVAVYVFLYSIFYYFRKLHMDDFVATMLYFGYSTLMSFGFFLLTGTIGFFASFWFIRGIYGAIKIE